MTSTTRVLLGLGAGIGAGLALRAVHNSFTDACIIWIEPVGTLWLNALRMTVIPLVVSLLITGAAAASNAAAGGRAALRALLLVVVLLSSGAALGAIVAPAAFAMIPLDPSRAAALRAGTSPISAQAPSAAQWISAIVPANPFKAASDGAMLSLVVFALCFGFAATRIDANRRQRLVEFFQAVAQTMMVIVRCVLWVAPVGVFALVLPMAARAGASVIGGLASYLAIDCALIVPVIVAMYVLASVLGRVGLRRFARAAAPAQAVAAST